MLKYCYYCGEAMLSDEAKCPHCGRICDNYILEYEVIGNEYCTECGTEIQTLNGETHCCECGNASHKTKQEIFLQEKSKNQEINIFTESSGKCRHCQKNIDKGTLCNRCLGTLRDNQLSVEERKKRNKNEKIKSWIMLSVSIVFGMIGYFRFDSGESSLIFFAICVALFYSFWKINRKSFCEECGCINSIVRIDSRLVQPETLKEFSDNEHPSQYKSKYKHTYQCKECGCKKSKYSNSIT